MSDWHDELRDRLAADAEAYEASSPHGSTVDSNFETDNPGLAKTLRMLQAVFLPSPDLPFEDQAAWETMGRFAIKRRLGTGNFGSVWLAHDPLLKRDVAIKVAHVGIHARPDLQERFEREGHLAARLHHPNIVPVFETGVDQGRMFIVSEYSPGPSLETWLQERAGPIEPRIAAELVRQLADAADHAHRQGLIHRDIKPGNVLLTISGDGAADLPPVPRLTDFGLARDLTSDTSATQNGVMLGTIGYMSPEQASGKLDAQGPASDIFSLGVLLYRLLSGTAPFAGETDFETIQQVIRAEPVPLTRRCANVTRDLNSVCLKCLERMPVARYATAAELNDDLDRYLRGEATVARPISGLEQMTRWAKRAPAVASLVFVVFASLIAISAGLGFYLQVVERHSREMAIALQAAHEERHAADAQRQIARAISYRSDMRLAFDLRERGEIHPVLEILARQQPQDGVDLRGPEWFVLDAEYKAKYRELGRQEGAVTECLLTRDEQTVYSAGTDGVVRVRNLATGKLLRIIRPVMGEIHAMALSPDETTLALGGETWDDDRARVALFDAATGERRGTLQNHATTIESIEFSPDGRWLAAGSRYEPVQLTRLADDASFTLNSDRRNRSVSFSSDSELLAIADAKTHATIWQVSGDEPEMLRHLIGMEHQTAYAIKFSPKQQLLASTYEVGAYVSLFEPTKRIVYGLAMGGSLHSNPATLTCVAFGLGGERLAAGDKAGAIHLWELDSEQFHRSDRFYPIAASRPHTATVTSVAVRNDLSLISGGEDGRLSQTSLFRGGGARHVRWRGIRVNMSVMDGGELLMACEDGTIRHHAFDSPTELLLSSTVFEPSEVPEVLLRGSSPCKSLAVSSDRQFIAVGTEHGGVWLYRRDTGDLVRCLVPDEFEVDGTDVRVEALAFSSNGERLARFGQRGTLTVVETATGQVVLSQVVGNGWSVAILPDDRLVACGGRFEGIRLFDIETGKLSQTFPGTNTTSLDVSDDGRWIFSSHLDGTIRMLDRLSGNRSRAITGHRQFCESITHSFSAHRVISLDLRGVIQFTDEPSGECFGRLTIANKPDDFDDMQVHCDDQRLVITGNGAGPVSDLYVWELGGAADCSTRDDP